MSLELCNLGSGSAGNSTLLRVDGRPMLIDAGFGPRAIRKRLNPTGVAVEDLDALLLTHLDRDHFTPTWLPALAKLRIPLYLAERHLAKLYRAAPDAAPHARRLQHAGLIRTFSGQPFELTGREIPRLADDQRATLSARVHPLHLAHDRTGVVGFVLRNGVHRLGYATDLGRVPPALLDAFAGVDLLALESNYDPHMEAASDRPAMLKQRITGGRGHLSNEQALDAIRAICHRSPSPPRHLLLLHLSRQCNCPRLVRDLYKHDPALAARLCLTRQHAPTPWLRVDAPAPPVVGEQLPMFA